MRPNKIPPRCPICGRGKKSTELSSTSSCDGREGGEGRGRTPTPPCPRGRSKIQVPEVPPLRRPPRPHARRPPRGVVVCEFMGHVERRDYEVELPNVGR